MSTIRRRTWLSCVFVLAALGAGGGCQTIQNHPAQQPPTAAEMPAPGGIPHELSKVVLPTYIIEPPDILLIDAIHVVPRPPYHLRTLDVLAIQVQGALPEAPIAGMYAVEPGGFVRLGPRYGAVKVGGLTVEEAEAAIAKHLRAYLQTPDVSATLADTAAKQQIAGQHLVGPDGTVTLGTYGSVRVVGLTIAQARMAIQQYLWQYLEDPEISLDVYAYNSKFYYLILQGAGFGDQVYRVPITGNETILDALSQINGTTAVSSKRIWIARPTPEPGKVQVLPVNWEDITARAEVCTNYQVLPGDRVFVAQDELVAADRGLEKLIAPLNRIMGFSIFGVGAATRFSGHVLQGGGNPQNTF